MTCDESPVYAVSPDGVWRFEEGALRSATSTVAPFEIDFFERWTFARFLSSGELVLAFESGQPWTDDGSYGDRYGGVEVLALTAAGTWSVVALEYEYRAHDETFVPADVAWHPRGVLAWLHGGYLYLHRAVAPGAVLVVAPGVWKRDSDVGLAWSYELLGTWHRLNLDPAGLRLMATDADGVDEFNLDGMRRARGGGAWANLDT